jgi:hypothetical protein
MIKLNKKQLKLGIIIWMSAIAIMLAITVVGLRYAKGEDTCFGFIDSKCCCTNGCCYEVEPSAVQPLGPLGNRWRILETGQEVLRTDWSPDGRTYRCACTLRADKGWAKDPKASTRCLYPSRSLFSY